MPMMKIIMINYKYFEQIFFTFDRYNLSYLTEKERGGEEKSFITFIIKTAVLI